MSGQGHSTGFLVWCWDRGVRAWDHPQVRGYWAHRPDFREAKRTLRREGSEGWLTCLGDVTQKHSRKLWFTHLRRWWGAWGFNNGQQMWGEFSSDRQNKQTVNDLLAILGYFQMIGWVKFEFGIGGFLS